MVGEPEIVRCMLARRELRRAVIEASLVSPLCSEESPRSRRSSTDPAARQLAEESALRSRERFGSNETERSKKSKKAVDFEVFGGDMSDSRDSVDTTRFTNDVQVRQDSFMAVATSSARLASALGAAGAAARLRDCVGGTALSASNGRSIPWLVQAEELCVVCAPSVRGEESWPDWLCAREVCTATVSEAVDERLASALPREPVIHEDGSAMPEEMLDESRSNRPGLLFVAPAPGADARTPA
jgi:hypothetical protein